MRQKHVMMRNRASSSLGFIFWPSSVVKYDITAPHPVIRGFSLDVRLGVSAFHWEGWFLEIWKRSFSPKRCIAFLFQLQRRHFPIIDGKSTFRIYQGAGSRHLLLGVSKSEFSWKKSGKRRASSISGSVLPSESSHTIKDLRMRFACACGWWLTLMERDGMKSGFSSLTSIHWSIYIVRRFSLTGSWSGSQIIQKSMKALCCNHI